VENIPGVGDDDVVEGRVGAPEARKPDLDHHFRRRSLGCGVAGRRDAVMVLQLSRKPDSMFEERTDHPPVNFGPCDSSAATRLPPD
jgi:hypothetical protein